MESLLFSSTLRLKVVGIFFLIQNSCRTQKSLRYKQVSFRWGFFSPKDLRSQVCINREQWRSEKKFSSPKKRKNELIQLFLCATKFCNFLKPALIKFECAAKRNYKYRMMEFNREGVNYLNNDFSNRDNSASLAGIMITQQKNCDRLKSEWS